MTLTNKSKASELREKRKRQRELQEIMSGTIAVEFHQMVDDFHRKNVQTDNKLELQILKERMEQITDGRENLRGTWDNSLPTFSPSSSSSSDRDLFFKVIGAIEDEDEYEPYQKRQTRNGSSIHEAMQRDFIYMEKYMKDAPFEILRTREGKPAWERNTRTVKQFEHNGQRFQVYGMVDGVLWYKPERLRIGYDFKTKSTTVAAVGDYKMKTPQESHIPQMVTYSLLFDVVDYIIHYESLAKDSWMKGKDARNDMKVFHVRITEEMQRGVLDKFARVTEYVQKGILPPREPDNELFSKYKTLNEALEAILENGDEPATIPLKDGGEFKLKGVCV